jgi:hypothetical protein
MYDAQSPYQRVSSLFQGRPFSSVLLLDTYLTMKRNLLQ